MLEVLRDPAHAALSVDDLIKIANISRATYYNAFRDSNFIAHLESEMAAYRSANDFSVMHNLAQHAKTGNSDRMISMYQRLQGRLKEGGDKPAQIILIFGDGNIERPKFDLLSNKIIEGEVIKDTK